MRWTLIIKRISAVAAALMLPVCVCRANMCAEYEDSERTLAVTGNVHIDEKGYINDVSVRVFAPGKSVDELAGTSPENAGNVLAYVGQLSPDKFGNYGLKYKLKGVRGYYRLLVTDSNGAAEEGGFTFSDGHGAEIAAAVNGSAATAASVKEMIEAENEVFNNGFELYEILKKSDPEGSFLESVGGELLKYAPYEKEEDIFKTYRRTIIAHYINTVPSEDGAAAAEKYSYEAGIKNSEPYKTFLSMTAEKRALAIKAAGKSNTAENLARNFCDAAVLTAVNYSEIWKETETVLEDNRGYLTDIDYEEFDRLKANGTIQNAVKLVTEQAYASVPELCKAVNSAMKKNTSDSKPQSGGGGGGSKTGSITPLKERKAIFEDIESVAWAKEAIEALAQKNVINGKEKGRFYPHDYITREEFVKILVGAFSLSDASARTEFSDCAPGAWYTPFVASAQKCGIVGGIGNNLFGTGKCITREEMAVIAARTLSRFDLAAADANAETDIFSDDSVISEYARESVYLMHSCGVINGVDGGRFAPQEQATRAQAAAVVYRMLEIKDGGKAV